MQSEERADSQTIQKCWNSKDMKNFLEHAVRNIAHSKKYLLVILSKALHWVTQKSTELKEILSEVNQCTSKQNRRDKLGQQPDLFNFIVVHCKEKHH